MKKLLLSLLFVLSVNVYALEPCDNTELTRIKELANNVSFTYKYQIDEYDNNYIEPWFNIEINNYNEDLIIYYKTSSMSEKEEVSRTDFNNIVFPEKEKVSFYIYAYTVNLCSNKLLRQQTVNIPTYNTYYYFNKDTCSNYPEFKYCKEYLDIGNKSFKDIDKELKIYQNSNNSVLGDSNNNMQIYILISLVIIFVIGFLILIRFLFNYKKKNKDLKR